MAAARGSTDPPPTSRLPYPEAEATKLRQEAEEKRKQADESRQKADAAMEAKDPAALTHWNERADKLEELAKQRIQEAEHLEARFAGPTSSSQQAIETK
eukprot:3694361-Amphidinium_carterae.1